MIRVRPRARLVAALDTPGHTVLVVDDDASIRMLCRLNLELDGWSVREAATLAQGREQLVPEGVDVVLLDMHVGSENSVEFLRELRRERPGLKVAMLTGSDDLQDIDADSIISKPFKIDELRTTVAGLAPRAARTAG